MKNIIYTLILLLALACANPPTEVTMIEEDYAVMETVKETALPQDSTVFQIEERVEDDCAFDLSTQTMEFLDSIQSFSSFMWIDSITTAAGLIGQDSILVQRGGCVHYNYYTTLIRQNDTTEIIDTDYWFGQVLEVTHLLPHFENETIQELYAQEKFQIEFYTGQTYITFQQNDYCAMNLWIERNEDGLTQVSLGYYLC